MSLVALRSSRFGFAAGLLGLICLSALPTQAQVTVYSNDFNNNSTANFTSANLNIATRANNSITYLATPDTGSNRYGFGAGTATLTVNNPALVGTVTIGFDLYIIGSMDGNGPAGGGPDNWQLAQNGNNLLLTNFANYDGGGNTQAYTNQVAPYGPGGSFAARTGSDTALADHLGIDTGTFGDSTYHLSFTFVNVTPTIAFDFSSTLNEGANNEGWGLDNVLVTSQPTAVPEPGSIALLVGMGVTGAAFLRRRKRAQTSA